MKKPFILLLVFLASAQLSFAQALPDSIQTYVVQTLDIMKQNSLKKHTTDWEKLYAKTLEDAKTATTIRATYPVIQKALKRLGDGHSGLYGAEVIEILSKYSYEEATSQKLPMPSGRMVEGKYAMITIPGFAAFLNEEQLAFTDSLQSIIKALDALKPKGWIIDLRNNQGGNFEPTMAGLLPILGNGNWIGYTDSDGKPSYETYKNGTITGLTDSLEHTIAKPYTVKKRNLPVAVLVSKATSSSGEFTAISFVGRKNTKLIGTNTLGLTTSNQPFILSDGAWLNLTTTKATDRNGKVYGRSVAPDIALPLTDDEDSNNTLYLETAIKFLKNPKK
ncbi:S41 family peptidase [Pontibacter sp. HSC-36F09]|uniref:S41 family peptidase n=1 Tax=Pontibacter sp. HSC-36F09 TaxID=2910966 RepID=UPI0020A17FFA|nr:S41 family peptidase [Pontibacter sp. HSC-36F09]MCP2045891.1 C-terminal processing protease CtpA/Prc [Pontibacter sp. HSC-36F09]